jgi:hypothetical protein
MKKTVGELVTPTDDSGGAMLGEGNPDYVHAHNSLLPLRRLGYGPIRLVTVVVNVLVNEVPCQALTSSLE